MVLDTCKVHGPSNVCVVHSASGVYVSNLLVGIRLAWRSGMCVVARARMTENGQ